jgi:hypothetical protein
MITPESVAHAHAEIISTSKVAIETATAVTWGSRAVAAYALFLRTGDLRWFADAVEYDHEAREHAAEAGVAVLAPIADALDGMKEQCFPREGP